MRKSINTLPGILPLGGIDPLDQYIRERGATDIEFLAAETVGVNVAAFVGEELPVRLEEIRAKCAVGTMGIVGFLKDAHHIARLCAAANGNNRIYSQVGSADQLSATALTTFLAEHTGMSQRAAQSIGRHGMRIFTQFWDGSRNGEITMNYDAFTGSRSDPLRKVALVTLYDGSDFINIQAGAPFHGEGNIAQVPGAPEAVMEDAFTVANAMIQDYSGLK